MEARRLERRRRTVLHAHTPRSAVPQHPPGSGVCRSPGPQPTRRGQRSARCGGASASALRGRGGRSAAAFGGRRLCGQACGEASAANCSHRASWCRCCRRKAPPLSAPGGPSTASTTAARVGGWHASSSALGGPSRSQHSTILTATRPPCGAGASAWGSVGAGRQQPASWIQHSLVRALCEPACCPTPPAAPTRLPPAAVAAAAGAGANERAKLHLSQHCGPHLQEGGHRKLRRGLLVLCGEGREGKVGGRSLEHGAAGSTQRPPRFRHRPQNQPTMGRTSCSALASRGSAHPPPPPRSCSAAPPLAVESGEGGEGCGDGRGEGRLLGGVGSPGSTQK